MTVDELGVALAATQAEQEAGTSVNTMVTPGRQQYHPSAMKAGCLFNGTVAGTNAPVVGYNVTSVTRTSLGLYTVNLTTPFTNGSYWYQINAAITSGSVAPVCYQTAQTASAFSFQIVKNSDGSADDSSSISVTLWGDQ